MKEGGSDYLPKGDERSSLSLCVGGSTLEFLKRPVRGESEVDITLRLLEVMFGDRPPTTFRIRLWEGTVWPADGPSQATLILQHPGAMRHMFLARTEVGLAEAYLCDDFDVEGDIEAVFQYADVLQDFGVWLG